VVNCAAWTAVDEAEANQAAALAVNGRAVAHLAAAYRDSGATLVQVSTDYVFDGTATAPYAEHDPPAPRTAYGRSKLAGERAALTIHPRGSYIVRTACLYGAHGRSFVRTMIARAQVGESVAVVDDQYGQPTWTADVARQIRALVTARAPAGIYHATSSGWATRYELARVVFELLSPERAVVTPTSTTASPRRAPRPAYSVLGHDAWAAAGLEPIGHWRDALGRALPALLASALSGVTAQCRHVIGAFRAPGKLPGP
jgi:dTDP-4-dehydrorhamnose reductase